MLAAGDLVRMDGAGAGHPPGHGLPFGLLALDESLAAIDKPPGLRSVPDSLERDDTAVAWCRRVLPPPGYWAAHRLDRGTSGVLLLARTPDVRRRLAAAWDGVRKVYWAVVDGRPPAPEGQIDEPLLEDRALFVRISRRPEARRAVTGYRLLATGSGRSLVEARPLTGRKHQIRVHLAALGCPVAGDGRYGGPPSRGRRPAPRLWLHAAGLSLAHPATGRWLDLRSPYPADFPLEFARHAPPDPATAPGGA